MAQMKAMARLLGADVILEMVGGDFPEKNLTCLAVFGRMVVFGAASRERGTIVPAALMRRCHAIIGLERKGGESLPAQKADKLKC